MLIFTVRCLISVLCTFPFGIHMQSNKAMVMSLNTFVINVSVSLILKGKMHVFLSIQRKSLFFNCVHFQFKNSLECT